MTELESDGPVMQSKKFVAFLISEVTWKLLAAGVLIWSRKAVETNTTATAVWAILMLIILVAGFVEAGYILGQAALDIYVRLAQVAAKSGHSMKIHGLEMTPPDSDPDPTASVPIPGTVKPDGTPAGGAL